MCRKMKRTGIQWLPEIAESFSVGYVKQYFEISKDLSNEGEPDRVLKLARAGIVEKDVTLNEGQMAASYTGYNKVKVGDLLLNPMDLYSGANCNVSELNGVISPAYSNLRAKDEGIVAPKFYDYYFKTQYWQMAMFAHGKGVSFDNRWTLNNDTLRKYEIPVVPYEQQKKIVTQIQSEEKKVDALISNVQSQIEKLKAYKQSLITEVVTKGLNPDVEMKDSGIDWLEKIPVNWKINRIKNVCEINPVYKYNFGDTDVVSYAPMECIKNGYMESKQTTFGKITSGLTCFGEQDIVMAKVTPCFENGNIAIARNLINGVAFGSSELFVFRALRINTKWLFYVLQNHKFLDQAKSTMTGTGGLKRVSPSFIKSFYVPIPPLDEQEKLCDYLNIKLSHIDNLISIKQNKIEKLNEYKKSLIYEYVTGKKQVI